jgi:hypothetical protein
VLRTLGSLGVDLAGTLLSFGIKPIEHQRGRRWEGSVFLTIGLGRGGRHGVGDECAVELGKSGGLGCRGTEAVAKTAWWRSFPPLAAPLSRDRFRVRTVRSGGSSWTSYSEPRPYLLFIAQCDRGPPTTNGLSAPDQGASQGPSGHWAILVGDQSNILPINLTLYFKL